MKKNDTYSSRRRRRNNRTAFFFLLPGMIIYMGFIGGPVLVSLILSCFSYNITAGKMGRNSKFYGIFL